QALFSYRPGVFQQGEFRFNVTTGSFIATSLVAVVVVLAVLTYRRVRVNEGRARDRVVLTTLRVVALGVVLFCLFRPTLIVRAAVNQQNVVAVLLDDSRSMDIADWNGKPRADFIRQEFGAASGPLLKSLSDRFIVRIFRFSATTGRITSVKDLSFDGSQTKLGTALDGAREELAGLPVSGVVLVSDGADTSEGSLQTALLGMKASKLPVFTVGVGSAKLPRDLQVDRVTTPRTVLKDASLLLDVVVTNTGYAGRTVTVDVEDDGRIIGSQRVQLPSDGSPASVRVRATASDSGPRLFRFKVAPQDGEIVTQNNVRESLVNVRDERARLLYYEGEPRFEMKFLRRAVADDKNLLVVTLQRTADNKFMRLDGDPDEVVGGFPKTREELFKYRGLILGSVEAAAFSADQLQMIADFVDRRGGGLLMLGGARSFGEGGYGGTPVADALPLAIDPKTRASEPSAIERLHVTPTRQGAQHAVTQIAETEEKSAARWPELPEVTSINAPLKPKPGATELMTGTDERGRTVPVLASHQFGRGKAIAFPVQDSWVWQMHASIPVEDQTHERFWRQMLRWVVEGVGDEVDVKTTTERVEPGEPVTIEANVRDKQYVEMNDATVVATVARPGGATFSVPLQWTGERDGQYRGTFVTSEPGAYDVAVDATRANQPIGSGRTYVRAAPGDVEFFDPTMHEAPLRRIADETGGRFYAADNVAGLAEDVRISGRGVTTIEERDLWNMPIILLTLMALVCGEWGYRRAVGLA
ncbi:MAG TPA: glutamine amidotransferase, partial [Vicinamibacterales bacterium]|nr:glutamine amidotransferase [Vicinamibacterales bacterium]